MDTDQNVVGKIEQNILAIRKYLHEFDEILSALHQHPTPTSQKELLTFSESINQPISNLSQLLDENQMGTTSSSFSDDVAPATTTSSSSTNNNLRRRQLDAIRCRNCHQHISTSDIEQHTCNGSQQFQASSSSEQVSSSTHVSQLEIENPHASSHHSEPSSGSESDQNEGSEEEEEEKPAPNPTPIPTIDSDSLLASLENIELSGAAHNNTEGTFDRDALLASLEGLSDVSQLSSIQSDVPMEDAYVLPAVNKDSLFESLMNPQQNLQFDFDAEKSSFPAFDDSLSTLLVPPSHDDEYPLETYDKDALLASISDVQQAVESPLHVSDAEARSDNENDNSSQEETASDIPTKESLLDELSGLPLEGFDKDTLMSSLSVPEYGGFDKESLLAGLSAGSFQAGGGNDGFDLAGISDFQNFTYEKEATSTENPLPTLDFDKDALFAALSGETFTPSEPQNTQLTDQDFGTIPSDFGLDSLQALSFPPTEPSTELSNQFDKDALLSALSGDPLPENDPLPTLDPTPSDAVASLLNALGDGGNTQNLTFGETDLSQLDTQFTAAPTSSSIETPQEPEEVPPEEPIRRVEPPELEFAEFLSNPKKKTKNYTKIGRVGGRAGKGGKRMAPPPPLPVGEEPPEFFSVFSQEPQKDTPIDEAGGGWKIAPRKPNDPLIRDLHCSADTNVAGLRRAKKTSFAQQFGKKKKGKPVLMEDTYYMEFPFKGNSRCSLFSVFDGHVGHECAETARDNFHLILHKFMTDHGWENSTDLHDVLVDALLETDKSLNQFEYEGCTATAAVVWQVGEDRYLQSACVGDSLAFLGRGGVSHDLSECHVVSNPAEKERMRAEGHNIKDSQNRVNGLTVSRSLGDHFVKDSKLGIVNTPYVCEPIKLGPDDNILIVATDGLWDVISGQDAIDLCRTERTARGMASKLLKHAISSIKCNDNVTVMVAIL